MSAAIRGPVLVTGASGQVGGALTAHLADAWPGVEVAAPSRLQMDLADPVGIREFVRRVHPRWIVSAGAYTAVDAAENDREAAFAANASAPAILAEEAAAIGAGLIHFSTDYVFNGQGTRPWFETDTPAPGNVYGESKLAGELAIADTGVAHVILRTSWVYSSGGKNFVRTMLRLLSTRSEPLRIVTDQHGAPTCAADLADAVVSVMLKCEATAEAGGLSVEDAIGDLAGVYHCAGRGETTWAGLAGAVREYLRLNHGLQPPAIIPVPTSEYPTPAVRPLNSRLNCDKLAANFGVRMPDWTTSVSDVLRQLAASDLPR